MKNPRNTATRRGFTLMELMVAMAVTTIIVTVLVSITSIALDTWNRSRAELRASRQAKSMIDTLARDFEALVVRRGNTNQWLSALADSGGVGDNLKSTNASEFIFFTAVTDRYNGMVGDSKEDKGGDVSCVAYKLDYLDPLKEGGTGGSKFETFVMNRLLVNPDDTFKDLLGQTDLDTAFNPYNSRLTQPENFICENVFQFTVTFNVQVTKPPASGSTVSTVINVPVTIGRNNSTVLGAKSFEISGMEIKTDATLGNLSSSGSLSVSPDELKSGRITSVDLAVTVISDFGIDQLSRRTFSSTQMADFLSKNSYEYTKTVQIPSM